MNKVWAYDNSALYTFDSAKIEVSGGIAKLKGDFEGLMGYWQFEDDCLDSSGRGHTGVNYNANFVDGKVGKCTYYNGSSSRIVIGTHSDFNQRYTLSIEAWVYYLAPPHAYSNTIMDRGSSYWSFITPDRKVGFLIFKGGTYYSVVSDGIVANGGWTHVVVTYNNGEVKFYIDNILDSIKTLPSPIDNVSASLIIGTRSTYHYHKGYLDEVAFFNRILSLEEVQDHYNVGIGRHLYNYSSDKPTIEPIDLFDPTVASWNSFLEILGLNNEGSAGYNLYKVDKVEKYYWNGSVWVTGGDASHYNSADIVNVNISSFDADPDKLGFVAYLISDGTQKVELDENQITYTENAPPSVNAGSNKSCKDNQTIAPFSDCSFSDPDGTVEHARYKIIGEMDTWIEILQNGYGTLEEAVQAFNYQFNNLGVINCQLQVEDNLGATSEDSLNVAVSKYQVTFNAKNSVGIHLPDISFNADDGLGWQVKNSPFIYEFEYNASGYDVVIEKMGYGIQAQNVPSTDHTENFTLIGLGTTPTEVADAIWDELLTDHATPGTFGKKVQDMNVEMDIIKAETNKIQPEIIDKKSDYKADTINLESKVNAIQEDVGDPSADGTDIYHTLKGVPEKWDVEEG